MGLLNPLYNVVAWILAQFHGDVDGAGASTPTAAGPGCCPSSGLVVVIRILLIPLFVKQIKAQRGLQMLLAADQGTAEEAQGRPAKAVRRADEAVPGDRHQPVLLVLADHLADADLLRAFPRAQRMACSKQIPIGAMDQELVDSAHDATIFGAPISATFLNSQETLDTSLRQQT